jgi:hypothetical protein
VGLSDTNFVFKKMFTLILLYIFVIVKFVVNIII